MKQKIAYTLKETAALLGLHPNTAYRLVREGRLQAVALGGKKLVPRAELERLGLLPEGNPAEKGGGR